MRTLFFILACMVASNAWSDSCKFKSNFDRTLDLTNADKLSISAGAGKLEVTGDGDVNQAYIEASICASEEAWIDESKLYTGSGKNSEIIVNVPRQDKSRGTEYFVVDLTIRIPAGTPTSIRDSSGWLKVEGSGDLSIRDSSGDIGASNIQGSVEIEDSSGDIDVYAVEGDLVIVSDSSGNINGRNIRGSVLVKNDSSGNIEFEDVQADVVVERDSSGNITVANVGGDFRVLKDGSGDIKAENVSGEIEIPEKG